MIRKSPFDTKNLSLILERVNSHLKDGNDQEEIKVDLSNDFRPNEINQLFEHLHQMQHLGKYKWWEVLNLSVLAVIVISFAFAGYMWLNLSSIPENMLSEHELNPGRNFIISIVWIASIVIHFIGTIRNHSQTQLFFSVIYILTVLLASTVPIEAFSDGIYWIVYSLILITMVLTIITIFKCKPYLRHYKKVIDRNDLDFIHSKYLKI